MATYDLAVNRDRSHGRQARRIWSSASLGMAKARIQHPNFSGLVSAPRLKRLGARYNQTMETPASLTPARIWIETCPHGRMRTGLEPRSALEACQDGERNHPGSPRQDRVTSTRHKRAMLTNVEILLTNLSEADLLTDLNLSRANRSLPLVEAV